VLDLATWRRTFRAVRSRSKDYRRAHEGQYRVLRGLKLRTRATSLVAEIEGVYPNSDVHLIESSGGVFEVTVDGDVVFSKKDVGRHAEPGEVLELMSGRDA